MHKRYFLLIISFLTLASCSFISSSIEGDSSCSSSSESPSSVSSTPLNEYEVNRVVIDTLNYEDPYKNVSYSSFYRNYSPAKDYLDARYRTEHGFISGENPSSISTKPITTDIEDEEGSKYYISNVTYLTLSNGEVVGYKVNSLDGEERYIYKDGGYITLNDVAAYLLAFGTVPANHDYDKEYERYEAMDKWGDYARVNNSHYRNNGYNGEPILPYDQRNTYYETDFGRKGYLESSRGAYRFVFTSSLEDDIYSRHVFYTYDHYDSFIEYLNYDDGFGTRFGNGTSYEEYVDTHLISLGDLNA